MSRASDRLREFHEAFEVGFEGTAPRRTLHDEEHDELDEALAGLGELRDVDPLDVKVGAHLMNVAQELADEMVLLYGDADLLGIDLDAAFEAVMDANMAKLPDCEALYCIGGMTHISGIPVGPCPTCHGTGKGKPIKRDDGKVLKGPGWQPPDMSVAIRDNEPALSPSEFMQAEVDSIDAAEATASDRDAFRREVRRLLDTGEPIPFDRLQEIVGGPGVADVIFEHSWALDVPAVRLTGISFDGGRVRLRSSR